MAAASFLFANDPALDVGKIVQLAVLHDIAEAIIGDIAPTDGVAPEEKVRREAEASVAICEALGGFSTVGAQEMGALLHEYEARVSPEAIAVKDLDMLEMIVQADEYERRSCHAVSALPPRDADDAARAGAGGEGQSSSTTTPPPCTSTVTMAAEPPHKLDLTEFFESTQGKFKTPQVQALVAELVRQRERRLSA
jgi:hypothetical protein